MRNLRETFGGLGNRLFQLAYLYSQARKGTIPDIYLQDPSYFEPYGEEIRRMFSSDIKPIDRVSIHIRRGDYINNPFYVDLNETDYYEKAIAEFPGEKFLVFCADRQNDETDQSDKEWAMKKYPDFEFWEGKDEISDFNAMAGCKAHIIANSSFSWWSAYVGGGKTVAPAKWYTDAKQGIPVHKEWILI